MAKLTLEVNGFAREVEADPSTTLAMLLREGLGLRGTKIGCGNGECGSGQVLVEVHAADVEELLSERPLFPPQGDAGGELR